MHSRRTLDGRWFFVVDPDGPAAVDPDSTAPTDGWAPIVVPGFWQTQVPGHHRTNGAGWYRTEIDLEGDWLVDDLVELEFGAVSFSCQVWWNGVYLGDHEGGHLAFTFSLTGLVRPGRNQLIVRVVSPSNDRGRYPDWPFDETLHGKQSWYGPTGGIWQPVSIVGRRSIGIGRVDVLPQPRRPGFDVRVNVRGASDATSVTLEVIGDDGTTVCRIDDVEPGRLVAVDLDVDDVQWWSPETPHRYTVRALLADEDGPLDHRDVTTGLRTFGSEEGRFVLNGRPVLLRGVLDQDVHDAPGVCSRDEFVERFRSLKALGFNLVRLHIKVPDPEYLSAADEVGIMVWTELPTTTRLTDAAIRRLTETLEEVSSRDRHHPSIVIWGVANESWGFDLVGNPEHRLLLRSLWRRLKERVGDALVIDNSPCAPNFHVETDIEDYHFYAVLPEMRARWDRFLNDFVHRLAPTFSRHGDAVRRGDEPLVVSEFGVWGLPDLLEVNPPWWPERAEPWWFETGTEWADGAAYVHGAGERFRLWHLDAVFDSWSALCGETQRRQFETMRHQIESMRHRAEIAGWVLTELADVHWESNGLFDMWGRPRSFAPRLAAIQADTTVLVGDAPAVVTAGDEIRISATVVNDAPAVRSCVSVEVTVDGEVTLRRASDVDVGADDRLTLDEVEFVAPESDRPTSCSVRWMVRSPGRVPAEIERSIVVIPCVEPVIGPNDLLFVRSDRIADRLVGLGYQVTSDPDRSSLRVLDRLEPDDCAHAVAGGRVLLLAQDRYALGPGFGEFPPISLQAWNEALYGGGDWISAFSWLRRTGRFASLPGGPLLDEAFEPVVPNLVVSGLPPMRFETDVVAGAFVGWVHQVAATLAFLRPGLGSVLISTLDVLGRSTTDDPMAAWLLHQMIGTAWEQDDGTRRDDEGEDRPGPRGTARH